MVRGAYSNYADFVLLQNYSFVERPLQEHLGSTH